MKKTAKFTAIMLVVALALSCFSVAFAEGNFFERIFGIENEWADNYLLGRAKIKYDKCGDELVESLKKGDLKKSMYIIGDYGQYPPHWYYSCVKSQLEQEKVPQLVHYGFVKLEFNRQDGTCAKTKRIGFEEMKLWELPINNPVLDKLEEWSVPALDWTVGKIGDLMGWDNWWEGSY